MVSSCVLWSEKKPAIVPTTFTCYYNKLEAVKVLFRLMLTTYVAKRRFINQN